MAARSTDSALILPEGFILETEADSSPIDFECPHLELGPDGTCLRCGLQSTPAPPSARARARTSARRPPILAELNKYAFNDDIKAKAAEIFVSMGLCNLRAPSLKKALCYCLYQAHVEKGICTVPLLIGRKLGLSKTEVFDAMKLSNRHTGASSGSSGYVPPVNLIEAYAKEFNFTSDFIQDMKTDFGLLLRRVPQLEEKPACTLVAGFIWYYLSSSGLELDPEVFAEVFLLRFATIRATSTEISKLDN